MRRRIYHIFRGDILGCPGFYAFLKFYFFSSFAAKIENGSFQFGEDDYNRKTG